METMETPLDPPLSYDCRRGGGEGRGKERKGEGKGGVKGRGKGEGGVGRGCRKRGNGLKEES